MQALEGVFIGGRDFSLFALSAQIVRLDRYAIIRIGFLPSLFRGPVVALIGAVNDRQKSLINDRAIDYLHRVFVNFPTDTMPIKSRRGEHDEQRLPTRAGRGFQNIVEFAVRLRVELIEQYPVA